MSNATPNIEQLIQTTLEQCQAMNTPPEALAAWVAAGKQSPADALENIRSLQLANDEVGVTIALRDLPWIYRESAYLYQQQLKETATKDKKEAGQGEALEAEVKAGKEESQADDDHEQEWAARLAEAEPGPVVKPVQALAAKPVVNVGMKQNLVAPMDIFSTCTVAPAPLNFVLPGMLAGTVNSIVSSGGVGKSMLALEISLLKAGGIDILGGSFGLAATDKVTILAVEDPEIILQHRVHDIFKYARDGFSESGWSPANSFSPSKWAENCRIIPLSGTGFRVDDAPGFERICDYAEGQDLVIVDTLRRCHCQDENDNGEMSTLLNIFERATLRTGTTFLLLHHVPKPNGMTTQATARGASSITDNMRYIATMRTMSSDEAQKLEINEKERWKHVIFEPSKNNYCPPVAGFWYTKTHGGVLEYQGVLDDFLLKVADVPKTYKKQKRGGKGGYNDDI